MFRKKNRQVQVEEITIGLEKLVPENYILRTIDKAIDFSFIYEELERVGKLKIYIVIPCFISKLT